MKWIKSTLCCDCYTKINLLFYSAQLWAQNIGMQNSVEDAKKQKAVKYTPPAASMFAGEDISCPLNLHNSDGELRRIIRPNPSSKPRARHSLLRELNMATVSQFTPREKLLYDTIRKKEGALCRLRSVGKI